MRSFESWSAEEIERTFGVVRHWRGFPPLERWLADAAGRPMPKPDVARQLDHLADKAFRMAEAWNEEELKMWFVSPLLLLTDFEKAGIGCFLNRTLRAEIQKKDVGGVVDFMLAEGREQPYKPYFFLHEYKGEGKKGNALGQLLIAMMAAQTKNDDPNQPVYGCYVLGRNWFAVVLKDNQYAVSDPFVASNAQQLTQIHALLCQVEDYIRQMREPQTV